MPRLLKKTLVRAEPEQVSSPLVKGKPEPKFPGCVLVRYDRTPKHPYFVKLNPRYNFKETYYRYDKKLKKVRCLVTVMPDGTAVAWDSCGMCYHYFTMCTCKAGVQSCRSIEYIHDSIEALRNGEEWGMGHPNYKGSLTRAEREARRDAPQRFVMPDRPKTLARPTEGPQTATEGRGRILAKAQPKGRILKRAEEPPRRLLKKTTADAMADASERVDATAMRAAADEVVDALVGILTNGSGGKKLLRKSDTTPGKKLLKRTR